MSGRLANPFYTDPTLGAGFANLAAAFGGDPAQEGRLAAARYHSAQADQITGRMDAAAKAGEVMRARGFSPESLGQIFSVVLGGGDPALMQQLPAFVRGGYAAGENVDPNRLSNLFVGAGGAEENSPRGFARTDDTRRRGQDVSAGATLGAARIGADAQRDTERMRQEGQNQRFHVTARPGDTVTLPENTPVAPAGQSGPVTLRGDQRPQTFDQGRAALIEPFLNPPPGEDPAVQERRREVVAPGTARQDMAGRQRIEQIGLQGQQATELQQLRGDQAAGRLTERGQQRLQELEVQNAGAAERARIAAAARPPLDISGTDAAALDVQIAAALPEGEGLDQAAAAAVRTRAAEIYQQNRNMPLAAQQAVREFLAQNPPRVDSWLNPFSDRRYGVPTAPRAAPPPPPPPQTGGYRLPSGQVIPEGETIRQNGRTYIIRNGQPVPAS